ncbi:MAG: FAD-dependent oxidoreductase [Candidatus Aenigmatarchaeota archaeon]
MDKFDVVIIGAGPAGLFAAKTLANSKLDIVVVEMGKDIEKRRCNVHNNGDCIGCSPCDITHGVGGAGAFTDFKLNLSPHIGMYKDNIFSIQELEKYIKRCDEIFISYGVPKEGSDGGESATRLVTEARKHDIIFLKSVQKHVGTENAAKIIKAMKKDIEDNGISFLTETEIKDINKEDSFVLNSTKGDIKTKFIILCPGRSMSTWTTEQAKKLCLKTRHLPLDVGVRVELPYDIFVDAIPDEIYDPKLICWPDPHRDKVRTFCTNRQGFVITERINGYINVNGHCFKEGRKKSMYTNFALLATIELTKPFSDTLEYGMTILKQANTIGERKPIIQRLIDLKLGRRSTWERIYNESSGEPTLKDVVPGDITLAMPGRIIEDIKNGLKKIDKLISLPERETFLYAPEVKFYPRRIEVIDKSMEALSEKDGHTNIYVAGDGVGWSRGIVGAAVFGIIAGDGLKNRLKI